MYYISPFEPRSLDELRREEGREEGRLEGLAEVLIRLIEHRFGPVPQAISARVANATLADLEIWYWAVLDAPTPDAVFAG